MRACEQAFKGPATRLSKAEQFDGWQDALKEALPPPASKGEAPAQELKSVPVEVASE